MPKTYKVIDLHTFEEMPLTEINRLLSEVEEDAFKKSADLFRLGELAGTLQTIKAMMEIDEIKSESSKTNE